MIAITIRIEPDRYAKIEELRGNIPRADFLRDIIDTYLQQSDSPSISKDAPAYLNEIEQLKKELQHSDTRTSDLQIRISDLLSCRKPKDVIEDLKEEIRKNEGDVDRQIEIVSDINFVEHLIKQIDSVDTAVKVFSEKYEWNKDDSTN